MVNKISPKEYDTLNNAVKEYNTHGVIKSRCPRCGNSLVYESFKSVDVVHCKDPKCIKSIRRGI